jgi:hypothetical protein
MEEIEIVQNEFNSSVQPIGSEDILIGYVEEVNGVGAKAVPEFIPTRHELLQLVKYWERIWLADRYDMYWSSQVGSTAIRRSTFARIRVNCIADVLGGDVVEAAIDKVWEDFGKTAHPRAWDHFRRGVPLPERAAEKLACGQPTDDSDWGQEPEQSEL